MFHKNNTTQMRIWMNTVMNEYIVIYHAQLEEAHQKDEPIYDVLSLSSTITFILTSSHSSEGFNQLKIPNVTCKQAIFFDDSFSLHDYVLRIRTQGASSGINYRVVSITYYPLTWCQNLIET